MTDRPTDQRWPSPLDFCLTCAAVVQSPQLQTDAVAAAHTSADTRPFSLSEKTEAIVMQTAVSVSHFLTLSLDPERPVVAALTSWEAGGVTSRSRIAVAVVARQRRDGCTVGTSLGQR